jgi:hypothetical protein
MIGHQSQFGLNDIRNRTPVQSAVCALNFELAEMEAEHITPWREGGKTNAANC